MSGTMRKVSSGNTAPITIRDTKIIFGKCRGGVIPQLYAAANSSGARMFAMERKLERPAAISPRPKPRPVSNDIAAGCLYDADGSDVVAAYGRLRR